MRLGYFTNIYPRATDTFIQREVVGLRKHGIDVRTFSVHRTGSDHDVSEAVIAEKKNTFYLLPFNPLKLLFLNFINFFNNPIKFLGILKLTVSTAQPGVRGLIWQFFYFQEAVLLAQEIRKQKIDHIHNHFGDASGTVAMLASRLSGVNYSMSIHGPHIFFDPTHWALREKVKYAEFIACISNYCRSQMMFFSDMEDWNRLRIVHCGVEIDRFEFNEPKKSISELLYVGRLSAEKGLPILFDSLAQLNKNGYEFKLTIIGDGKDKVVLKRITETLGISNKVYFAGYANQDGVKTALSRSDIFILPSFAEGVPVSLMEAMASGVPVIGTFVGGVVELIQTGISGQLVSPGDTVALTDAIARYLDDYDFRVRVAIEARRKVEAEFNIDIEVDKLAQIFLNKNSKEYT